MDQHLFENSSEDGADWEQQSACEAERRMHEEAVADLCESMCRHLEAIHAALREIRRVRGF